MDGTRHDSSIDIENLAKSVRSKLESLNRLSGECTIHRVEESLRQIDQKAYTPRIVSIGPIHHGKQESKAREDDCQKKFKAILEDYCKKDFKAMEEYKSRCLNSFLKRTKVPLEAFIKIIKKNEKKVRNCFAETIEFESDEFVEMVLIDAIFILEVLRRHIEGKHCIYDRVYGNPHKIFDVVDDLYMLENQLPFFILQDLFTQANIKFSCKHEKRSLLKIIHEFSKYHWSCLGIKDFDESKYSQVKHLVDFLRISIVPSKIEDSDESKCSRVKCLVDFLRISIVPWKKSSKKHTEKPEILTTPSVTELHQAGVKFKVGSSKRLFDITFKNGVLEIPRITIGIRLEFVLKNLMAFDQSQCEDNFINDYLIFMNYLVNTREDVELLVDKKIIYHPFGDSTGVSSIFHSLVKGPMLNPGSFYFLPLVEKLNGYCDRPWHKWKATLKKDYFNSPWTVISFIAAVFVIILTAIQTFCSIKQVKW